MNEKVIFSNDALNDFNKCIAIYNTCTYKTYEASIRFLELFIRKYKDNKTLYIQGLVSAIGNKIELLYEKYE